MALVGEAGRGKGRRYREPVTITSLPDGTVRITEHDGDQFLVRRDGSFRALTGNAAKGATDGRSAAPAYEADDGTEQAYFGSGYVQLTWWSNYAAAVAAIDRGLDLLLDPEVIRDPATAYQILSVGMRTGKIVANGRRLEDYFTSLASNYKAARRMVNGTDNAQDIADIAIRFERVLKSAGPEELPPVKLPPLH